MSEDNFHKLKNMVLLKEIFFFFKGWIKKYSKIGTYTRNDTVNQTIRTKVLLFTIFKEKMPSNLLKILNFRLVTQVIVTGLVVVKKI